MSFDVSVIHPTARVRKSQAFAEGWRESMLQWFAAANRPDQVEYVVSVHSSRWTDFWHGELGPVEFPAWGRVVVTRNAGRDDNVTQVNAAAAATSGNILVGNMDDLFAPPGWDTAIRSAVPDLDAELVVHCSSGSKRDWEPLVNAGAITRARYLRFGYVLYPKYESMYSETEFTEVAYMDRVVVQRPDIRFSHRHWSISPGLASDEVYEAQNRQEAYLSGRELLLRRRGAKYPADIPRPDAVEEELLAAVVPVPSSPTFKAPAVQPIRKSVALCFPGDNFSDAWNAHTFALAFQMVQEWAVFPPLWGYSSNVYTIRSSFLDKLLKADNKPDLVLWLDSDNLLTYSDFKMLAADLDEHPDADLVAAWCWCKPNNYRVDQRISAGHFDQDGKARALAYTELETSPADLVAVEYTGFPAVLMRYSVLERVGPMGFAPILHPGYAWGFSGEDVGFSQRAIYAGCRMFVDRRVRVPHLKRLVDDEEGLAFVERKAVG